ncbi:hypothetical protein H5397_09365 [Propioniciclava sp. MC1683]|jgi:hypothetical protein|nr:hypothetical protein [Propioniciclava sp. MC1683]MBB1501634.1 hypothetical protein [Propioniciclava sp. MC1683]
MPDTSRLIDVCDDCGRPAPSALCDRCADRYETNLLADLVQRSRPDTCSE